MEYRIEKEKPEELKLLEEGNQIMEEFEEIKNYVSLSKEDTELIRLGKLYKKKRRLNMYITLVAVLVLALGICVTSMGGVNEVFRKISFLLEGKEYIIWEQGDRAVQPVRGSSEDEAFYQIEDTWGFWPVCFEYRPEEMQFREYTLVKEHMIAMLTYKMGEEGTIFYDICPNYGRGTMGIVKDDICVGKYEIEVNGISVTIAEFVEETTQSKSWDAYFTYKDVWYKLSFNNIEESEVQKIVKNLMFN